MREGEKEGERVGEREGEREVERRDQKEGGPVEADWKGKSRRVKAGGKKKDAANTIQHQGKAQEGQREKGKQEGRHQRDCAGTEEEGREVDRQMEIEVEKMKEEVSDEFSPLLPSFVQHFD